MKFIIFVFALCAAAMALPRAALSQPYPSRPPRIIVPFAPGGSADLLTRIMGQHLTESLGQPVITDNRLAAGGIAGTDLVPKAAPDGHTLLLGIIAGMVIAPALFAKVPYDLMNFHGLHAPLKTPAVLVARLNSESSRILKRADIAVRLNGFAMDIVAGTPEQYRAFIKAQITHWAPVVKASGARTD